MTEGMTGRVVVITGASSGLGEATARLLAKDGVTEPDVAVGVREIYKIAIPSESFARMVAFAIGQPEDADVNEILFRPTAQET